ncbi:TauD/TfdA dioxygenase family protein [Actinophytocola oryzae]|uniref:Taurine dioxygenase n=1 Tax=Actinophytocola oryzae TaxID=502181 RepID=A0A4R7VVF8_9PSEU|nr:TauD/TfdA family dioxygenase [Actinophytocola oryzae]TDV53608.1 taurine dioxygenase [Actinophytocola oryzae]
MRITAQAGQELGVTVEGFAAGSASAADIAALKEAVYTSKIAVLKDQDLTPRRFLALGRSLGREVEHFDPAYDHSGSFWHSDYQLMTEPYDFGMVYPKVVPIYFIDTAAAYKRLSMSLKQAVSGAIATHSLLRHVRFEPEDLDRALPDIVEQVNGRNPPLTVPAAVTHPRTGETLLHVSEGFTLAVRDADGEDRPDLLAALLEASGQLDQTYRHENIHVQTFEKGDLLVWDNRSLIHRAPLTATPEPALSVYDG